MRIGSLRFLTCEVKNHFLYSKNIAQKLPYSIFQAKIPPLNNLKQNKSLIIDQSLCAQYCELDKPSPSQKALDYYSAYIAEAKGPILASIDGTGEFLLPFLKSGYNVTGVEFSADMLDICRKKKCTDYALVLFPGVSFSLLTKKEEIDQALTICFKCLKKSGKLILEIDTPKSIDEIQEKWLAHAIDRENGEKILLNTLFQFDSKTHITNIFCRYELWKENTIVKTETNISQIRLYEINEIERLLKQQGFKIINKWIPYTKEKPNEHPNSILYECIKK